MYLKFENDDFRYSFTLLEVISYLFSKIWWMWPYLVRVGNRCVFSLSEKLSGTPWHVDLPWGLIISCWSNTHSHQPRCSLQGNTDRSRAESEHVSLQKRTANWGTFRVSLSFSLKRKGIEITFTMQIRQQHVFDNNTTWL